MTSYIEEKWLKGEYSILCGAVGVSLKGEGFRPFDEKNVKELLKKGYINEITAGGQFDVGGGELSIGGGMSGDDKAFGIGFRKQFSDGSDNRRMYSGRMMTEEQIQAIRDRRKVPKKEGMVYDKETKQFRPRKEVTLTEGMSEKSAEARASKQS